MGSILARTLLETNQEVPEFLQLYLPQGMTHENLKFETESNFDPNDLGGPTDFGGETSSRGGWGADGGGAGEAEAAERGTGGWGTGEPAGDNQIPGEPWGAGAGSATGGDSRVPTHIPAVDAW